MNLGKPWISFDKWGFAMLVYSLLLIGGAVVYLAIERGWI